MVKALCLLASMCLAAAPGPPARADALPSGQRAIDHPVSLVVAPELRERCLFEVTIRTGDILSKLAQQHLGKAGRWREIVERNPGLEPDKLRPGTAVLLPAQDPGESPPYHLFLFSHHLSAFDEGPTYLRLGEGPAAALGDFVVVAVRDDHLAAFQERTTDQHRRVEFLMDVREGRVDAPWLALSEDLGVKTSVSTSSPIHRMRTVFEVRGMDGSRLEVAVQERQRFDQDGDEMSAFEATLRSRIFLAGLGAAGFLGLLFLALFRRR